MSASQPNEPSFESDEFRHGLFTHFLLEGLAGKADRDGDGVVTVREAYDYTYARVAEVSQQRQRPLWKSEESGVVALVDRRQRLELANLVIRSQPAGATVFVGGRLRGVAKPELIVPGLPVGQHEVVARLEGYAEARQRVTVAANAAPVVIALTATRGGLRVASVPAGAKVIVDAIERGQTELTIADLAPGAHQVEVTHTGYRPYQGSIEVRAGEVAPLNLSLEPLERRAETEMTGILHVTSEPEKAQVYLDGALVGETPLTLEKVATGDHRLRVSKRFYEAVEAAERIEPVRATRRAVRLTRSAATLIVRSDLGEGELLVDGKVVGKLQPLQKVPLEAGPHRVAVRHPQAGTITRDIELGAGSQTMRFSKADHLGSLTILSDVPLSRLTVQGRAVDPPPVTVENLLAGEVLISGRAAGGYVMKRAVVKPGATVLVRIQGDDLRSLVMEHQGVKFEFVEIPTGEFMMGCSQGDAECDDDEKPAHRVTISKPFEIGKFEVTQAQWQVVMGNNPSHIEAADRPVNSVSWNDVQEFLKRLNARQDGHRYRVPTEAEWEYAARAGTTGKHAGGLDAMGWHSGNSDGQTHTVGQKQPNAWGLYDMHGNVWEWCQDWYAADYYRTSPVEDPQGPTTGQLRVLRGGSWDDNPRYLRASFRNRNARRYWRYCDGFRCAREVIP